MRPDQIKLIHVAVRQLDWSKPQYRNVLRNLAGVESSTELNQKSFEIVMAFIEGEGFHHQGKSATYWRDKVESREWFANERVVQKIEKHVSDGREAGWLKYTLEGLCERVSSGRTRHTSKLDPREAYNLIEMLKSIESRETDPRATEGASNGLFAGNQTATR